MLLKILTSVGSHVIIIVSERNLNSSSVSFRVGLHISRLVSLVIGMVISIHCSPFTVTNVIVALYRCMVLFQNAFTYSSM